MPLRQWGGVSLFVCSLYIKQAFIRFCFRTPPALQKSIESGQNRSKVNIYLLAFVFSREFWRPKTAKVKYILGLGLSWCCFHPLLWWRWWCPPSAGGRLLWLVLLSCRVPCLLPAFLLCLWCIALEYGSISRFKGVFSAFWGVRGCLCCLGALR